MVREYSLHSREEEIRNGLTNIAVTGEVKQLLAFRDRI